MAHIPKKDKMGFFENSKNNVELLMVLLTSLIIIGRITQSLIFYLKPFAIILFFWIAGYLLLPNAKAKGGNGLTRLKNICSYYRDKIKERIAKS